MYSGTTFRIKSGRVMGVHQRIDRVAKRQLRPFIPSSLKFPTLYQILHYEGLNGPDGIKRKSPAKDEPWHYINPEDPNDTALLDMIDEHISNMGKALRSKNVERAAFEAAWMAHAITDGLTPAHHYPLESKLEELRCGEGIETRTTTKEKILLPGKTRRHQLENNWEFWGAKGVMTTHFNFELGVATTISTAKLTTMAHAFNGDDIIQLEKYGFRDLYLNILSEIHSMGMYDEFQKKGWTRHLAKETKQDLIPLIIKAVVMGWYAAILAEREGFA
ncbi:hypothetical protein GX865_01375 [Candidatus Saccharibacteria bacterium]|jgi:hypothetical protein|nr:hypothetical protein [Candidatus Saccharibacteria bacterium]